MTAPIARTFVAPDLPVGEYDVLCAIGSNNELFERLQAEHRLELNERDRMYITNSLVMFADMVFSESQIPAGERSDREIVAALDRVLAILDKQKNFPVRDPRRRGYDYFVRYSQRPDRRDQFDVLEIQIGPNWTENHYSLGRRVGWLEALLREIRDDLETTSPRPRRGPKCKARYRTFLIWAMAVVYERRGGKVTAYQDRIKGKIGGDFVRFVIGIIDAYPPTFARYTRPGIENAILRWIRTGRPSPVDVMMGA